MSVHVGSLTIRASDAYSVFLCPGKLRACEGHF